MLKPIILHEIKVPIWIKLLPFSKFSYIKKQINRRIISRTSVDVRKVWEDVGVPYESIMDILNIIAKYCDWKSINFIPSDELSCIFMDYDLELGTIIAIEEIEGYLQIESGQLYKYLNPNSDLLCLIRFVIQKKI